MWERNPRARQIVAGRKRALFTGKGAEYGGAEIHGPPREQKNETFFEKKISFCDWCFLFFLILNLLSISHTFVRCLENFFLTFIFQ